VSAQEPVQRLLEGKIASGEEIGLQVAAYLHGELVVDAVAGVLEQGTDRLVEQDSLFTVFSCSKGVTATLVHLAAERRLLDYDDRIAQHWPEFGVFGKAEITLRQTLCHTAGLPDVPVGVDVADWDTMCWAITQLEPRWEPGTATGYSGLTFGWLLGEVLRRVCGRSLSQLVAEELGLHDLFYGVPDTELHRVATLTNHASMIDGPSADYATRMFAPRFNARSIRQACIPAGGVVCSARALARMYAGLIGTGVDGARLLPQHRMAIATTLQTDAVDLMLGRRVPKALGYVLGEPGSAQTARRSAFGHTGHGGSIGFADPDHGLTFAITKNHLRLEASGVAQEAASTVRRALGIPDA